MHLYNVYIYILYTYVYIHIYNYVDGGVNICISIYIYRYLYLCLHIEIPMYIYIDTHVHSHICIHNTCRFYGRIRLTATGFAQRAWLCPAGPEQGVKRNPALVRPLQRGTVVGMMVSPLKARVYTI